LLRAAVCLETDAVLVVPGAVDNSIFSAEPEIVPYDAAYETAQAVLCEIAAMLDAYPGVYLAVENVWNKFLLSPKEMREFIDAVDSPWVGCYLDTANMMAYGYETQWIRELGPRIRRVHFKDFRRREHRFVPLLEGDTDWPGVVGLLREIGYDGFVIHEVGGEYELQLEMAARMRRILGR
ncbi:MAG TPA: sugar phosphate isomerase/epimerase family protein, partial [Limnochordia bacterium]